MEKLKKDFITGHDAMLVDLESGERLHFQGLPSELNINPETTWATITPFGRNNPHYHFTGSEDSIEFEVSWYAEKEDRSDVIEKCKWVESLMKADGYDGGPHLVSFIWGDLFKTHKWIVYAAPYKLSLFSKPHGMRPQLATQTITLKRVTDSNLKLRDVLEWR